MKKGLTQNQEKVLIVMEEIVASVEKEKKFFDKSKKYDDGYNTLAMEQGLHTESLRDIIVHLVGRQEEEIKLIEKSHKREAQLQTAVDTYRKEVVRSADWIEEVERQNRELHGKVEDLRNLLSDAHREIDDKSATCLSLNEKIKYDLVDKKNAERYVADLKGRIVCSNGLTAKN